MTSWQIGDVTVQRVLEFEQPLLPAKQLLPAASDVALARHRDWLVPRLMDPASGLLIMAFHSFLIRSRGLNILVDTCGGNDKPRPGKPRYHMNRHPYLENLRRAGVAPEDIDIVMCTHLHVDHVGWNTRLSDGRWIPTFPRARYLFARAEWKFWEAHYKTEAFTDDPYYVDSILPVIEAGLVDLVEMEHAINEEVRLVPTPGHTPGHVCVQVRSLGAECVMSGDLMHHAVQCAEPDWSSCFCVDPAHSSRTRRAFLGRYEETQTVILPAHFPTPTGGRIRRRGDAWRFEFLPG